LVPVTSTPEHALVTNILVVGAGPTGLTMAAALARHGVRPRVIDRAVQPPDDRSRAIVIQARTLELFDDLGIVREVLDAALVVTAANVFTRRGGRGTITIRPEWIDSAYGRFVTLPQEETERILEGLVTRSGVTVERGVELVGFEEGSPTAIAVLQHADGRRERVAVDYVLGCDGAHSAVRRLAGIPFPGSTYQDECLLGDVDMRWRLPDEQVSICPAPDGVLLAFPLPGQHRFRVIMILPATAEEESRHLDAEEFLAQLRRMVPAVGGAVEEPTVLQSRWLTRYRLHSRGVPTYRKGSAFVAGDAAHIHSPAGAQGMNTGIQDAYNLGWKLGLVALGQAPAWVLDSYHVERHRVGEMLLRSTDRMFAVLAGGGRLGVMVRRVMPSLGIRMLGWPVIGRRIARFVSQAGIRYRHSPLTVEAHGAARLDRHAPHAGDRAPDVALGYQRRITDLLRGPQHTLLLFAGRSTALIERYSLLASEVSARYGTLVRAVVLRLPGAQPPLGEVDEEGAAHDRYGADPGAIYLVRPDGYVGFRGAETDIEPLRATLRTRFLVPDAPRR
jgi:2-polyprenyl-6-methoxyphenol hydroxylase-like FAD-dependent oxidoreductase